MDARKPSHAPAGAKGKTKTLRMVTSTLAAVAIVALPGLSAPLDAAITFAPSGDVVAAAVRALDRGGVVAVNAIHLDRLVLGPFATINRSNWITGYPKVGSRHFAHRADRDHETCLDRCGRRRTGFLGVTVRRSISVFRRCDRHRL